MPMIIFKGMTTAITIIFSTLAPEKTQDPDHHGRYETSTVFTHPLTDFQRRPPGVRSTLVALEPHT